jgi:outer membrane lipoprotein-sorting protein
MDYKIKRVIFFCCAVTALSVAGLSASTAELSVTDILKRIDKASYSGSSQIYMTQTVINPSGDKRVFKMVSYSLNGTDKALTKYLAPAQVAGMKILTLNDGDDIWSYFPRTNRTRKIASSARNRKVQGSDFTYEDMSQGKMSRSWKGSVAGSEKVDGSDCYRLNLVPSKDGPESYSKSVAWVDKKEFVIRRIIFFDSYGEKLKELTISGFKKISGVNIPFKYVMTNLQDGGRTIMTVASAKINISIDTGMFSEAALGK